MGNNQLTHAGCVVFRTDKKKKRYLVITSKKDKHWVFPKGHIEPGIDKSPQDAALRELKEEAGLLGEIVQPTAIQTYMKDEERVVIQYFIVRMIGSTQSDEKRTLKWMSEKMILESLTFDDTKQAFHEALETMKSIT